MQNNMTPTIKGIFVMSHVRALEKANGPQAVEELSRRLGKPINYRMTEDVPVRDEVAIIEAAFDIMSGALAPHKKRAYEAGKLHFNNFMETQLGQMLIPALMPDLKTLLMHAGTIGEQVFRGVKFKSEDIGEKQVRITMENNDYPLDHFCGFFQAWLDAADLIGSVAGKDIGKSTYIYTIQWK